MTNNQKYIVIVLIFVVGAVLFIFVSRGRKKENIPYPTPAPSATIDTQENKTTVEINELKIEDLVVGEGKEATSGAKITVNYLGTLADGTKFDSSYDKEIPFTFNLGAGEVIQGWEMGFIGMKVGGKRRLTIPPSLGYGEGGAPPVIGPNATLIFEVELLKVE